MKSGPRLLGLFWIVPLLVTGTSHVPLFGPIALAFEGHDIWKDTIAQSGVTFCSETTLFESLSSPDVAVSRDLAKSCDIM